LAGRIRIIRFFLYERYALETCPARDFFGLDKSAACKDITVPACFPIADLISKSSTGTCFIAEEDSWADKLAQ
jgi:hypothetical protein